MKSTLLGPRLLIRCNYIYKAVCVSMLLSLSDFVAWQSSYRARKPRHSDAAATVAGGWGSYNCVEESCWVSHYRAQKYRVRWFLCHFCSWSLGFTSLQSCRTRYYQLHLRLGEGVSNGEFGLVSMATAGCSRLIGLEIFIILWLVIFASTFPRRLLWLWLPWGYIRPRLAPA